MTVLRAEPVTAITEAFGFRTILVRLVAGYSASASLVGPGSC